TAMAEKNFSASRPFTRNFASGDQSPIKSASFQDMLSSIQLVYSQGSKVAPNCVYVCAGARVIGAVVVHVDDFRSGTAVPRGPGMSGHLSGARLDLPDESLLTIPGLLFHVAHDRAAQLALRVKRHGLYRETKWSELADQVTRIGRGLIALGVQRGDRVAIVGDPLPEWLLADFAVQCLGAITYGLYPTSARDEVEFVLRHGGASVLIAEDQEHVDKALPMLERLPRLRKLVVIDESNM